jgi:DNA-binding transcriptional LysR family regulator
MSVPERHYFKELRLQQFRGLIAVIRSGSFSAAAKALRMTKASIWQQVRALEEEFGCVLLESAGRRVLPTAQGLRLAELSTPLVEGFDSIKEAFCADLANLPAELSVATTPGCLTYELRGAIEAVRSRFPTGHLTFQDRNSPAAIDLVESGEVDVAVAARFEEWPQKPALELIPFTEHPFALAAPAGHPLLEAPEVCLADLANYPLLLPGPKANCRPRLERLLRGEGVWDRLRIVLECSFPSSLLEYVEAGLGVTVTPVPSALLREAPHGRSPLQGRQTVLRDLSALLGKEPLFYVRRRGWHETPIAVAFRTAILQARSLGIRGGGEQ